MRGKRDAGLCKALLGPLPPRNRPHATAKHRTRRNQSRATAFSPYTIGVG